MYENEDKEMLKGDKKYYWLTSVEKKEGTSSDGYMHYANMNLLRNNEVFLTEGPLKADIASNLSQRAFIAIPGSSCYKLIESNAEKLKTQSKYAEKWESAFDDACPAEKDLKSAG